MESFRALGSHPIPAMDEVEAGLAENHLPEGVQRGSLVAGGVPTASWQDEHMDRPLFLSVDLSFGQRSLF